VSWYPPETFVPVLSFPTISNQTYAVEFSPDLAPGSWSYVPGITENFDPASKIQGDGGEALLVDTNAINSNIRFYRVQVLP
jgi:hypothetical protein